MRVRQESGRAVIAINVRHTLARRVPGRAMEPSGLQERFAESFSGVDLQAIECVPIPELQHPIDATAAGDREQTEPLTGREPLHFPSGT
jgi:hypothetical protein